jgi:hypothetical protein
MRWTFSFVILVIMLACAFRNLDAQDALPLNASLERGSAAQPDGATLDQVIDRIFVQERNEDVLIARFHPRIETRIRDYKVETGEALPWNNWTLRGEAEVSKRVSVRSAVWENPETRYDPAGFLEEAFIDRNVFDREHFALHYVGQDTVSGQNCLVFDVEPRGDSTRGLFRGRIWAEDQDFAVIRFSGKYSPHPRWEFLPVPHRTNPTYLDFDSWRAKSESGSWLPAYIFSHSADEGTALHEGRAIKAETQFYGYEGQAFLSSNAHLPSPIDPDYVPIRPHLGKSFWTPWVANAALFVTFNELTARCLQEARQCQIGDPLLGKRPTRAEMYGVRGPLMALDFYVARRAKLRPGESGFWWRFATYLPLVSYALNDVVQARNVATY